ncbi:MAG: hypothetical protein ACI857_000228 [Arenicella sp.]|jgi:hypothetical protein
MKIILSGILIGLSSLASFGQNTFPTSGNVGIGTSTPSERLDVNGNMIVDSCLIVKDSVLIEKDLRTKGRFIVEDKSYFLEKVYMYDKLIMTANVETTENLKANNNVVAENNVNATNNINVGNKLNVTGASKLEGPVKMPNLPSLSGIGNENLQLVLKTPSGQLKTYGIVDFINAVDSKEIVPCSQTLIDNPYWMSGPATLVSRCPEVKVGVGTANPLHLLHVSGTSYSARIITGNADSPIDALINGYVINNSQSLLKLGRKTGSQPEDLRFEVTHNGALRVFNQGTETSLEINNGAGHALIINDNNGNKILQLENDGFLRSRHIKVDTDNWADYVFDEDYELMPLHEVEEYITAKGHLPNMPSAKELEEEGLDLGDMQALQMEKIEELYLHVIDLEKKLVSLQSEVGALKIENQNLKNK